MELRELANAIGITAEYPAELVESYRNLPDTPACDLQALENLEQTYHLFGQYYEQIYEAGEKINADPLRSAWVKTTSRYIFSADLEDTYKVPAPGMNGDLANDFLALFALMPPLVSAVSDYLQRGFSQEELTALLSNYAGSIGNVHRQEGFAGVNQGYFNWLVIFAKGKIFMTAGFWFELGKIPPGGMWLKNRKTGVLLPIVLRGIFCADGKHRLGSGGFENCTDTFEVTFEETEDAYIGHGVYDCVVSSRAETFLKSEWECYCKPHDDCLSLHIPRGTNISPENVAKAMNAARELMHKRYPDMNCNVVFSSTWLLDPSLQELTEEKSRLHTFGKSFSRYPQKHNGMSAFSFVFPRYEKDYNNLPENTSLQRKLKKHYMDGKFIYFTAGIYKD